ncbi:MAG: hypothetical protein N4A47_05905 [Clostridia bacterium]|jgi:hypothetical protein|nr:hypothetical protein [Clostridia bacterium]
MINLKEELKKFKPIENVDQIEKSLKEDEIIDLIDVLKEIVNNSKSK